MLEPSFFAGFATEKKKNKMEIEIPGEGIRSISLRSIFDALCAEHLGEDECSLLIDEIMRQEGISFDQLVIRYLDTLKDKTVYYLEGFIPALFCLLWKSKPVRDWVLSYKWELFMFFSPFDKKGWPMSNFYPLLEKQMHTIVDEARRIERCSDHIDINHVFDKAVRRKSI